MSLRILVDTSTLAITDEQARELRHSFNNAQEIVDHGISAIGLMLASIDYKKSSTNFMGDIGLLLDFLGDLSFDLHDAYVGVTTDFRDAMRQSIPARYAGATVENLETPA